MSDLLGQVYAAAGPYLESLAARPVQDWEALEQLASLGGPLPSAGADPAQVIERLLTVGTAAGTASSGPRFFHFVTGGVTPAALAADWTAALLDQNAFSKISSPFAHEVETVALGWLRELFGLPESWGGALVASATFANFTALGCATQWWGFQHGVDTAEDGLAELPRMPVLSSGYVHASARKALQMLGHGRNSVTVCARDDVGRVDLGLMRRHLESLKGAHAVIIANAGEVNAGHFDPIAEMARLAGEFGCWLHVDGAFGLFAALSPRTSGRVCPGQGSGPAGRGVRDAGRGLSARSRGPGRRVRAVRPRVVAAGPVAADLGDPGRVRERGSSGHGREAPRSGPAPRRPGRRRARPGTPGRRAALHRLLPRGSPGRR